MFILLSVARNSVDHILYPLMLSDFLTSTILIGIKQDLIVVLISITLITSDIKHFFFLSVVLLFSTC